MALNPKISDLTANTAVNAAVALANGGFLDIYDGTQPTNANTAVGAQVKLASLALSATAFASAVAGVATANAITNATALATSTAAWFRVWKSDHTTALWDGSVDTSGANLNLNSVAIQINATVAVSAFTYTQPEG